MDLVWTCMSRKQWGIQMRSSRENRVDSGVNKQEVTDEAEKRVRSFSSLTEGGWNENKAQEIGVMTEVRS